MKPPPKASFDNPFSVLVSCHRRIENFLHDLTRSGRLLVLGRCDASVVSAMEKALHFFKVGGPLHTRDEEESLIPRLNAAMKVSDEMYEHVIKHILDDHKELDDLHVEIDAFARTLIAAIAGKTSIERKTLEPTLTKFRHRVAEAREIYQSHMVVEERDIAPLAKAILSPEEIRAIGREMAERRGLDPDAPPPEFGEMSKHLDRLERLDKK